MKRMRTLSTLTRTLLLGCGVFWTLTSVGGDDGDEKKQKQAAQQNQQKDQVPASPSAKQKEQAAKQREARRARQHITATFPRTRSLLAYLQKNDADTYGSLLAVSAKLTERREAIAMKLARDHHPELAKVLRRLRRQKPRSYRTAIRDLVADNARLARAAARDENEYKVALREWKIRSQIRLVAARVAVAARPRLQTQLVDLLTQGEEAKRQQIRMQIDRYQAQIERLGRRLQTDPQKRVERQLRAINEQAKKKSKRRRKQ